jgi:hypothetical protein
MSKRHGIIHNDNVVELFENGDIRRIVDCSDHSRRYAEDVVDNWTSNIIKFPTPQFDPYAYMKDKFTMTWEDHGLSYEGTIQSSTIGGDSETN